jgi:ribose-phosphate pyrophosphokinase
LIGPDESEQWVAEVANASYFVRYDIDVEVSIPHVAKYKDFVPVLVDDIISTGRTMIETIGHLNNAGMKPLYWRTCCLLKTPFRN